MNTSELKAKFGTEAELNRLWLSHLECYGIQIGVTVTPGGSETETLKAAWGLVRDVSAWLLNNSALLPENERYEIIVGWSCSVRPQRGQIFKTGGSAEELLKIVDAPTYESVITADHSPLRQNWQKDVSTRFKNIGS
ncbi:hypothetical protein [Duganella hordei]|uniref:hypothetical protein n=1 Tax=Duganella hordei TaxID=2865934 RepID=UPI0030E7A116